MLPPAGALTPPYLDAARCAAFRAAYDRDPRYWVAQDLPSPTLAEAAEDLELFGLPALCQQCGRAYRPATPATDRCARCAPPP